MNSDELKIYNLLTSMDNWVDEQSLLGAGATTVILDYLTTYESIQKKKEIRAFSVEGVNINTISSGNNVYVPYTVPLKPSKNVSLRVLAALNDWSTGAQQSLLSKWTGYSLYVSSSDKLALSIYDGSDQAYEVAASPALTDTSYYWIRADWAYENGSGDSQADIYYSTENEVLSSEDVASWTLVESITKTQHTMTHATANLYLGSTNTTTNPAYGNYRAAEVWGENVLVARFPAFYTDSVNYGEDILIDEFGNRWIIDGSNFLLPNTTFYDVYYKNESKDFGPGADLPGLGG